MPVFKKRTRLDFPPDHVFAWHNRPGALERLIPPWEHVQVKEREGDIRDGRVVLEMKKGPVPIKWVARHVPEGYEEGRQFADEQVEGPFAKWFQYHRFLPADGGAPEEGGAASGNGASVLEDEVTWELPGGAWGEAFMAGTMRRQIDQMFEFRHRRTAGDLERHGRYADRGTLSVAITGSSGLIGNSLLHFLTTGGHNVHRVVRHDPGPEDIHWSPSEGTIDATAFEGLDAVVHLAGEPLIGARWTDEKKKRIRESRAKGTRLLSEALAKLNQPPKVLVSASAIGYYGDRGDEELAEDSAPGQSFLAGVCVEWEAAADAAREAGIRVVHPRIGAVLSGKGGALKLMLLPFKMAIGGRVGSGKQWMSWITLDDLVGVLHASLLDDQFSGPVNAVAPDAVTNNQFTRTLGRVINRPTPIPVPETGARMAFGEVADEVLLASTKVVPARLQAAGFDFHHPDLETALRHETGHLLIDRSLT